MNDFVIGINNESNPASLIVGKVYSTLSDAEAEAHNMLRAIDEDKSEPDGYLYPASMFPSIELLELVKPGVDRSRYLSVGAKAWSTKPTQRNQTFFPFGIVEMRKDSQFPFSLQPYGSSFHGQRDLVARQRSKLIHRDPWGLKPRGLLDSE